MAEEDRDPISGKKSFWKRFGDVVESLGKTDEERQREVIGLLWDKVAALEERIGRTETDMAHTPESHR